MAGGQITGFTNSQVHFAFGTEQQLDFLIFLHMLHLGSTKPCAAPLGHD